MTPTDTTSRRVGGRALSPARRQAPGLWLALLGIVLAVAGVLGQPVGAMAQTGPTLILEPAEFTLAAGEEKTLNVRVTGVQDFGGFQFDLLFPPDRLSLSSISLGPFLGSSGRTAMPLGPVQEAGRISYGGFSFGDAAGPNGEGIVAVLTLRGEVPGEGELRLERVQVLDVKAGDLGPTATGGRVTVTGDAPAPTVTPGAPTATPMLPPEGDVASAAPDTTAAPASGTNMTQLVLAGVGVLFLILAATLLVAGRRSQK